MPCFQLDRNIYILVLKKKLKETLVSQRSAGKVEVKIITSRKFWNNISGENCAILY